jgi:hypothetical protein
MARFPRLLLVALAAAVPACVVLIGGDNATIRAYDLLALPGETVEILAKLETAGPAGVAPDLPGAVLRFDLPDGRSAEATTDADGKARVRLAAPDTPGDHPVEVSVAPGTSWCAEPDSLLLRVLPPDPDLLVVDLDGTVTGASVVEVVAGSPEPYPGAPETLAELARERPALYLTARDDSLLARTREFLAEHGFPRAPLICADYRLDRLSAEDFKRETLLALRTRFRGAWTGVGDREEDARAYLAAGLGALVIRPDGDFADLPPGTEAVRSWKEIRSRLLGGDRDEPDPPDKGS